jgi:NAD(P)-dependent dehydrogenase (short-subunit alcohol dehydrogenase family)
VASHGRQSVVEARLLNGTILIYGATGYTGRLIAKAASDTGARPILAGRNLDKVKRVAEPLGLSARAFDLGDPARIDAAIKDVSVVLCIAGPFSATSRPVADACLRNRVHYLDITGEIDVFEALAARDAEDLNKRLVHMPAPLRIAAHIGDASLPDLRGEHRSETIPPESDGLMADVDPSLGQQILDVAQRQYPF